MHFSDSCNILQQSCDGVADLWRLTMHQQTLRGLFAECRRHVPGPHTSMVMVGLLILGEVFLPLHVLVAEGSISCCEAMLPLQWDSASQIWRMRLGHFLASVCVAFLSPGRCAMVSAAGRASHHEFWTQEPQGVPRRGFFSMMFGYVWMRLAMSGTFWH